MLPFFVDRYYCIALDLPGHGSTPYCDAILSALKEEMMALLPVKPFLIGYSMGGRIALQLQECAQALVNLSGHPGLKTQKEREERLQTDQIWSEKLLNLPPQMFFTQWYSQGIFHPLSLPKMVARRVKQNTQDIARVMLQMSLANQAQVVEFSCPTLYLYGENDSKYRDIFSRLPSGVDVLSIEHSGHAIHMDNAAGCAQTILKWFENLCK